MKRQILSGCLACGWWAGVRGIPTVSPCVGAALRMGAAAMVALACSTPARATDFFWVSPGGGPFTSAGLWQPFIVAPPIFGPGGAGDTVNFDLGVAPAARYTVTDVAGMNDRLLVHNDSITLDIPGGSIEADYVLLNDESFLTPSFTVGVASGDVGDVILSSGFGAVFQTHFYASIGDAAGSLGSVAVANLVWYGNIIHVGRGGTGHLSIEAGSFVYSSIDIGVDSGSTGTVTGAGSTLISDGGLTVGSHGTGALTVEAGGRVSTDFNNHIGDESGSTGTVTVTGAGSTWTNSSGLRVGNSGTGTLMIEAGGSVSNLSNLFGDCYLGALSGSTGTVTVTGAGSTWANSDSLTVGHEGTGTLTVEAGGRVLEYLWSHRFDWH